MFKSIQTKTMFFLLALAISLIIIIGYLTVFAMDYAAEDLKHNDMMDKAEAISYMLSEELTADAKSPDEKLLGKVVSSKLEGNNFMINSKGETIGYQDKELPYKLPLKESSEIQEIYKNDKYYVAAIAEIEGSEGWYFCTEEATSDYMRTLNNIKTIIIIAIIIILFILWPLGKWISFRIQKPIEKLASDAERIAEGDISRGITVSEDNELADIAQSFNLMLNKLKDTMQQVLDKSAEAVSMQEVMAYVDETYNALPSGIISINNIGEITTFNSTAEALTGLSAKELTGINIDNPTPPQIKKLIKELKRCLSRGSLKLKTITDIKNLAGETIPVEYSINIQFGLRNEVIGAICVFRKIDDIRSFEESANRVKTMEALGEIAASMAHEIKNPLTSIRGNAQYLEFILKEKELSFDEVDIILHETDRLTTMLNRFLNFARPKLPEPEKTDLSEIMEYVTVLISREMPDNIKIKKNFEKIPLVMADREMFESVFLNLMLNAIQAMPEGGKVIMETHYDKKRNMVCAIVRDNGSGIPPDISDKIFDPFFTTKDTGTGMGLPIASRIVEMHRGIIEVESIEGEMTEFRIMLQALPQADDEEE
ncbi:MAG: ATP-binding protein [Bacillota bacterium]|nr:ATP-binding protein [Bacillota bacterium]